MPQSLVEPRTIWCDESGYTGGDLINREQPLFAYAAHDLTADESAALVSKIRAGRKRPIQAKELKAGGKTGLRKRDDWPEIAAIALDGLEGRMQFVITEKRLAFAGKVFEYLVEPVIADNSLVFYRHGLHRLVASSLDRSFAGFEGPAAELAIELKQFMKTFDPADAPNVFAAEPTLPGDAVVLSELLRFARGYRVRIAEESAFLQGPGGLGKWVLDMTSTALYSLVPGGFGHRHPRLEVVCDQSGPLMDAPDLLNTWIDRTDEVPLEGGPRPASWRLNLAKPIVFGDSALLPGLQIADLAAGMATEMYGPPERNKLTALCDAMHRHRHPDYILRSDDDPLDPDDALAQTNLHVLRLLAERASVQADPIRDMEKIYPSLLRHYADEIVAVTLWREVMGDAPVPPIPDAMRPQWR